MLAAHALSQRAVEEAGHGSRRLQLPQQVVDQIDCGLLVCDAHGHMLHANRAALRELDSALALKVQDGVVCCDGPSARELAAAIKTAATRGLRRLLHLQASQPLMLVVMPLDPTPGCDPLVLVMIGRRTLCTPLGLELLALQHRLTWAEQRVLRAIVGGTAVRDIAVDNGVAVSTIRTQIQSIRDKLGVSNIDALLLIAARIPPVPSCH
jgi:DNA-binding NarL/FixJ family response regulator